MQDIKKLLLISDTHGALHSEILSLAAESDAVVHAGDVGNEAVIASLRRATGTLHCVGGNNDSRAKWSAAEHHVLDRLPPTQHIPLPGGILAVEHGHRANPAKRRQEILRRRYANARIVVYGHSHRLIIDRSATPWIVNPGAAGRSRTFGGPSCVLLTIRGDEWELTPHRFAW
jgi:putative phosphoesterase